MTLGYGIRWSVTSRAPIKIPGNNCPIGIEVRQFVLKYMFLTSYALKIGPLWALSIICIVCTSTFKEKRDTIYQHFCRFPGLDSFATKFVPCCSFKVQWQTRQLMGFDYVTPYLVCTFQNSHHDLKRGTPLPANRQVPNLYGMHIFNLYDTSFVSLLIE